MSDQSIHHPTDLGAAHHRRTPKAEYLTYFSLILVFALPVQTVVWTVEAIRRRALPEAGPLARAIRDARVITPAIFRP